MSINPKAVSPENDLVPQQTPEQLLSSQPTEEQLEEISQRIYRDSLVSDPDELRVAYFMFTSFMSGPANELLTNNAAKIVGIRDQIDLYASYARTLRFDTTGYIPNSLDIAQQYRDSLEKAQKLDTLIAGFELHEAVTAIAGLADAVFHKGTIAPDVIDSLTIDDRFVPTQTGRFKKRQFNAKEVKDKMAAAEDGEGLEPGSAHEIVMRVCMEIELKQTRQVVVEGIREIFYLASTVPMLIKSHKSIQLVQRVLDGLVEIDAHRGDAAAIESRLEIANNLVLGHHREILEDMRLPTSEREGVQESLDHLMKYGQMKTIWREKLKGSEDLRYAPDSKLIERFATVTVLDEVVQLQETPVDLSTAAQVPIQKENRIDNSVEVKAAADEAKELLDLGNQLRTDFYANLSDWNLSRNQIKQAGLLVLCRELQRDQPGWKGVIDQTAYDTVRTILRLSQFADTGGVADIEQLLDAELDINSQLQVIQANLREKSNLTRRSYRLAAAKTILTDLLAVQTHWPALSSLVESFWPESEARRCVQSVSKILGVGIAQTADRTMEIKVQIIEDSPYHPAEQPLELNPGLQDDLKIELQEEPIVDTPLSVVEQLNMQSDLREIAEQLDWEVFPDDVSLEAIQRSTQSTFGEAVSAVIEWQRIKNLLTLKNELGGRLFRSKPGSLGSKEPYFIAELAVGNKKIAVAENPVKNHATYFLREDQAAYGASWQEVFSESRKLARLLGAERVEHRSQQHLLSIVDKLIELSTIKI